jgi:Holliday junction resolvase RusA-like endonuclease
VRSEAQHVMTMASTGVAMLPIAGPVRVRMAFTLPRPKSAKKGAVPSKKPDLSKLVRATEDALTDAAVWEDDARVVHIDACKSYPSVDGDHATRWGLDRPGCVITVEALA